jgi:predicted O-linked N-acetylglucosamine transferase (SPINDLY family)
MLVLEDDILLSKYWQEGIDCILSGQDEDGQANWLFPFFDEDQLMGAAQLNESLVDYLLIVIEQKIAASKFIDADKLTQNLCLVAPENVNSLLMLLLVSLHNNEFDLEILINEDFIGNFELPHLANIKVDLFCSFVISVSTLLFHHNIPGYVNFIKTVAAKIHDTQRLIQVLVQQVNFLAGRYETCLIRSQLLEICLDYCSAEMRFGIFFDLTEIAIRTHDFQKAVVLSEQCNDEGRRIGGESLLLGSQQLLSALMEAGEWGRIPTAANHHKEIIQDFIAGDKSENTSANNVLTTYFLNYLYDEPRVSHLLRNGLGDKCSMSINQGKQKKELNEGCKSLLNNRKIKIGYIAGTLYKHSVGWLSRWIFQYHDRSDFQVFIYHVGQVDIDPFNRKFFRDKVDVAHYLGGDAEEIADLIQHDAIDILIDLDSLSSSITYGVICRKPAPVIVTWLGWDASGCPEVDYFIADPYVLPADAEEYYRTKIWRLPQTYLAIDGFEIEVPTKRRSDYNLPDDAIVYLCAQKSYKHHPDILRLQMQIIKQVPNSFLMVQLRANPESLMKIYQELANEVGITMEQLRFIQPDPDEMTHRANLQLADVVLDTFPYNGATTTLETLWMGVPLVTKVGQAFVARNSYAFMQNAGVMEGIAHTDEEYVDWGVRLGIDLTLRQQVIGKLLHSRKTSPLWNARSFTLEMENAYRQMWEIYQSQTLAQQK